MDAVHRKAIDIFKQGLVKFAALIYCVFALGKFHLKQQNAVAHYNVGVGLRPTTTICIAESYPLIVKLFSGKIEVPDAALGLAFEA